MIFTIKNFMIIFSKVALEKLEVEFAIRIYRNLKNVSMVWSLEGIKGNKSIYYSQNNVSCNSNNLYKKRKMLFNKSVLNAPPPKKIFMYSFIVDVYTKLF